MGFNVIELKAGSPAGWFSASFYSSGGGETLGGSCRCCELGALAGQNVGRGSVIFQT
jgi:hypothetical protein